MAVNRRRQVPAARPRNLEITESGLVRPLLSCWSGILQFHEGPDDEAVVDPEFHFLFTGGANPDRSVEARQQHFEILSQAVLHRGNVIKYLLQQFRPVLIRVLEIQADVSIHDLGGAGRRHARNNRAHRIDQGKKIGVGRDGGHHGDIRVRGYAAPREQGFLSGFAAELDFPTLESQAARRLYRLLDILDGTVNLPVANLGFVRGIDDGDLHDDRGGGLAHRDRHVRFGRGRGGVAPVGLRRDLKRAQADDLFALSNGPADNERKGEQYEFPVHGMGPVDVPAGECLRFGLKLESRIRKTGGGGKPWPRPAARATEFSQKSRHDPLPVPLRKAGSQSSLDLFNFIRYSVRIADRIKQQDRIDVGIYVLIVVQPITLLV